MAGQRQFHVKFLARWEVVEVEVVGGTGDGGEE